MFNLVYASTAARPFTGTELLGLLHQAREKNARLGITGLLLYKDGTFMQALEGDEATVRSLYGAIREDQRHHHVLTLLAMPIAARHFPNWSMGFKNLDDAEVGAAPGYNPDPDLPNPGDELSWQASVAVSLLATFKSDSQ